MNRPSEVPGTRTQPRIPRWRGFNLVELTGGDRGRRFEETEFVWIAGLGFDFVWIPMSYWVWSSPDDWTATWVPENEFESFSVPTWPMRAADDRLLDKEALRAELVDKWVPLVNAGAPAHVGGGGATTRRRTRPASPGWRT